MTSFSPKQADLRSRLHYIPDPVRSSHIVGVSRSVREGCLPVHGLRVLPVGSTSGWYIWAGGEMSEDPDFFVPLHASHLSTWRPEVLPYLEMPPGWRFAIAPGYEDVWFDPTLE